MATHFSILAWEILWTEEPGKLQSMGSQRVRHDLVTNPKQQQKQGLVNKILCSIETFSLAMEVSIIQLIMYIRIQMCLY